MKVDVASIINVLHESRRLDTAAQAMRRTAANSIADLPALERKRVAEAVGMDARSLELLANMAIESVPDGVVPRYEREEVTWDA